MELRARFQDLYGERLDRLVLFGSRARGDNDPDSDYDVLVVLKDKTDNRAEWKRVREMIADLSLRFDTVVMPIFCDSDTFESGDYSIYRNVRQEGLAI